MARLASTELKPSGSGPASSRPSRSIAAIASAAASRFPHSESTHASTSRSRGSSLQQLAREPLEPGEHRRVPTDVHVVDPRGRDQLARLGERSRPRPHARSPRRPSRGRDARRMRGGEASARGRARDARARRAAAARRDGGSGTTRLDRRAAGGTGSCGRARPAALSEPSCSSTASHNGPHSRSRTEARSMRACISGSCAPSTSSTRKSTTWRLSAAEPAHERVPILDCLERERREVEPGRPALGSLDEIVDVLGLEPELETIVQEHVCLGRSEAEVLGSQLEQLAVGAQRRQRERGLAPRCEHELERRGGVVDEPRHAVARRAAREPVEIVEHQRGIAECGQLVDQLRQERVHDARRSDQLRRRGHAERRDRRRGAPRARTTRARPGRCRLRRGSTTRRAAPPAPTRATFRAASSCRIRPGPRRASA